MPLYTQKEFADLCQMADSSQLRVYISRKNVITDKKGLIDSEEAKNKLFLQKREQLLAKKAIKAQVAAPEINHEQITEAPGKARKGKKVIADAPEFGFFAEEQRLKIRIQQLAVEKMEIDIQKKRGELLPVDLFMNLIRQYSQSNTIAFKNSLQSVINRLSVKHKMGPADMAEMRQIMTEEINSANIKALSDVKGKVKEIVSEYAETRERGERAA